jgi:hypothetical protein
VRRRLFLAGLATAAAPRVALAQTRTVPLTKAFAYLENYYGIPAADRSRFFVAYMAVRDRKPAPDLKATIVSPNGSRTPLVLDRGGVVTRLPSLAELKSESLEVEGEKAGLALQLRLAAPPSLQYEAALVEVALAQANQAVAKLAGVLSLVAPKLTSAYFPDVGPAHALMADGRLASLPVVQTPIFGPVAYFEPTSLVGARTVQLAKPPPFVLLGVHPKAA